MLRNCSLFLISLIFLFSCSSESDNSNEDTQAEREIIPLNDLGLLEFAIFSNNSREESKVIEGSDDTFNYIGYGESRFRSDVNAFVPSNLKRIIQHDPDNNILNSIELDNNLLPVRFSRFQTGAQIDTVYTVRYDSQVTEVTVELVDLEGNTSLFETINFPGVLPNNRIPFQKNLIREDGDCSDAIVEESEFNPCNNNSIYEQTAQNWRQSTRVVLRQVGSFVAWVLDTVRTRICSDSGGNFNQRLNSESIRQPLLCEELVENSNSFIRFLDTGETITFEGNLDFFQKEGCNIIYGINVQPNPNENICNIATIPEDSFINVISINSLNELEDGTFQVTASPDSFFDLRRAAYTSPSGEFGEWQNLSVDITDNGIFMVGNIGVFDDLFGGLQMRPVEFNLMF